MLVLGDGQQCRERDVQAEITRMVTWSHAPDPMPMITWSQWPEPRLRQRASAKSSPVIRARNPVVVQIDRNATGFKIDTISPIIGNPRNWGGVWLLRSGISPGAHAASKSASGDLVDTLSHGDTVRNKQFNIMLSCAISSVILWSTLS